MAQRRRLQPERLHCMTELAEFDGLGEGVEVIEVAVLYGVSSLIRQVISYEFSNVIIGI